MRLSTEPRKWLKLDLTTLKDLVVGGSPLLSIIAVVALWRQLISMQLKYEALVERCVVALTKVAEHEEAE